MSLIEDMSPYEVDFWRKSDRLQEALDRGFDPLTPQDVAERLETGQAQYWPLGESFLITGIVDRGTARILHVWLAAGKMEECLNLLNVVEQYGREMGCHRIEVAGRKGWAKVLAKHAYHPARIVLIKELMT